MQNQELLAMIEAERKKEEGREKEIKKCKDELERAELDNKYGVERAEAQRNIKMTIERHKSELARSTN